MPLTPWTCCWSRPLCCVILRTASYGVWTVSTAAANIGAIIASGFGDAIIQQVAARRANRARDQLFRFALRSYSQFTDLRPPDFPFPYISLRRATGTPATLRRIVRGALLANIFLVAGEIGLLIVLSGPLLKLLAADTVAHDSRALLPGVMASSGILALTVSAMLALGHVRTLAIVNIAAGLVMLVVAFELVAVPAFGPSLTRGLPLRLWFR